MTDLEYIGLIFLAGFGAGILAIAGFNWWRGGRERARLLRGGEWGQRTGPAYGKAVEPEKVVPLADALVESLTERPQEWSFTDSGTIATHKPTKRCLWVGPWSNNCTGYDELFGGKSIGYIQKADRPRVHKAAKGAEAALGAMNDAAASARLK